MIARVASAIHAMFNRRVRLIFRICIAAISTCSGSEAIADDTLGTEATLPAPVAYLVNRIIDCNYLRSEPPYSAERAKQLSDEAVKTGCDRLDQDEADVLRKYPNDARVKDAFDQAYKKYP